MAVRRNLESAIQRQLVIWLHQQGLEVVGYKSEGYKSGMTAKLDKLSAVTAGFPDLMIFKQIRSITHILHLELKTKDGSLNKNQVKWHAEFKPSGNRKLATAYGLIQAQEIITNWLNEISKK
jgi:hypothetical protein